MSDNLVFYLKYRPQALAELVGQEAVKKVLLSSFENNKLSHAYLFVGPRGTGKTSTARILAKMVNCESSSVIPAKAGIYVNNLSNGSRIESGMTIGIPCNKCATCISITDGSNLDLIEIDAASNRGIEDIRSLRDKIKLAPTQALKKVYIIDEVHMLTAEAFNALLKTLEEPPAHALFVLATTEGDKVPQTILSRVQRLDFKLAKPEEILEALSKIVKAENIDIDKEALQVLVRQSAGSFRDGIKLLDQVSSISGKITAKSLEEDLKIGQLDSSLDLLKALAEKNTNQSLLRVLKLSENGANTKELILSLMDIFRNLVFIKNGLGENLIKPQFSEDKYEELVKLAEQFSDSDLIKNLDILQSSLEKLKFASISSLPLELAIVEICEERVQGTGYRVQSEETAKSGSVKAISEVERILEVNESIIESGAKQANSERTGDASSALRSDELVSGIAYQAAENSDIQKLKEKWTFVLETIRPFNFSLEALLRSINVIECTQDLVKMEVPYSFHQRILESPKNRDLVESILSDILGRSIRISIILGNRPVRPDDVANIEVAADDEIIRAAAEIFNSDSIN